MDLFETSEEVTVPIDMIRRLLGLPKSIHGKTLILVPRKLSSIPHDRRREILLSILNESEHALQLLHPEMGGEGG